ncbi:hypothetical protein GWK48_10880 [Metallosphaera tengchongensis]|uniref:HEAT repeat domain-containing protein n=1 Tax=Metallosphaera tengchongensis TaxID=1532350 RepID=A0A6N0P0D5_9CREN|nr:hypothetical protein [Metallosphaera tengchongensis]QKR00821.1 hypothetical protein GWK48_10880 [Metallosphaera tengchongensis]
MDSTEDLIKELESKDREIKHEAWLKVERLVESGDLKLLLSLLCFRDHGTRYRAWNLLAKYLHSISNDELRDKVNCLLEMLKDDDVNVRRLVWYSTLPQLHHLLDPAKVRELKRYCLEVMEGDWKELLEETCRDV